MLPIIINKNIFKIWIKIFIIVDERKGDILGNKTILKIIFINYNRNFSKLGVSF